MALHPTKTRIALLDEVRASHIRREYRTESPDRDFDIQAEVRVNARIAAAEQAGWVELEEKTYSTGTQGLLVRYWRLTDAGRKVLDGEATRYRVEFARIGRKHHVAPFGPIVSGPDHAERIAEAVHRYAGRHLNSRFFDVDVDLAAGKGWIEGGRFGTFTVTRVGVE
ncbi:hypothetical protein E0H26_11570 [Micromonospora zingiberis]|uniref:Uncharacterized protein n=1 Tax=Micromonospora zingiberis TaxID=2053011 RepID=A0A4R0GPN1_9ACTN|nr:hypothetical protein [Micromonospora zingiberis]TCB97551.1 hypothetical protein E0H26_11570 [Micromonospora zingiberis]